MGTILRIYGPGDVRYDEYEERELKLGEVRLKTLFSGISAGTELTHYRGTNPFRYKKWDEQKRIFYDYEDTGYYPRGTGYEEVGEVTEVGLNVSKIKTGDMIYGSWSHKSTHIIEEDAALHQKLPDGLEPIQGVFSQIGSIALNGILDAKVNIGETVAIFGQGVVGLICTQLAKLSGCRVIAVDLYNQRLQIARNMGADIILNPAECNIQEKIKELTGIGADVCIEASGSSNALNSCIKSCVYSGRVVALGFYQQEARGLYLGEEFHHNRISLICSQIGGISPDLTNRWNAIRLKRTIMDLQKENKLHLKELITHKVKFEEAQKIYELLIEKPREILQSVLCF